VLVKSIAGSVLFSLALLTGAGPALAQLAPGAIVVYRVGTGAEALTSASAEVFLDVFDADGDLLGSIPLPTAAAEADQPLTAAGTGATEGLMNLSADCSALTLTGYAAAPGVANVATSSATEVPRVVGVVDATGAIDTTTALVDFASAGAPRSAVSTGSTSLWIGGSTGGARFATTGATTSTQLAINPANVRAVGIAAGQLYVSTSASTGLRLGALGAGLPTTAGQTAVNLNGFPTTGFPGSFAFFDLSPGVPGLDTLYVADESTAALTKYTLESGTWTADGRVGNDGDNYRGLAALEDAGVVTIVAVSDGRELFKLTDSSGYGGTLAGAPQLLETAATNTAYRGVAFAPGTPCPEPGGAAAALAAASVLALLHRTAR
jgi:hypothetical protein